jgi:hypothetical protein
MTKLPWVVNKGETYLTVILSFDIPADWIQFLAYAIVRGKVSYAWLSAQKLVKPGPLTFRRAQAAAIKGIKRQLALKGSELFEWYAPAFNEVTPQEIRLIDCDDKYEDLKALVDEGWVIYGWAERFGDQLSYTRNAHSSVGGDLP